MKKIIKRIKESQLARNIISSVIFLAFFQSPAEYVMITATEWLGRMGFSLVNKIFRLAAYASLYSLFINVLIAFCICVTVHFMFGFVGSYKEMDFHVKQVEEILNPHADSDQCLEIAIETKPDPESRLRQICKEAKKLKFVSIAICVMLLFLVAYTGMYVVAPHMLKSTFDINITLIKPYVAEENINDLESKWIQMKNYSDYADIDASIKKIKHEFNIVSQFPLW